jgi:transcriptional regulator with XRE-family HTH domain
MDGTPAINRIAISLPEARAEHGLSQRQLALLSGVSAATIRKIERGDSVDPALLVKLGATLLVLDAYQPPRFEDVAWPDATRQPPNVTFSLPWAS